MLKIEELKVAIDADAGLVKAIDGLTLCIERGETFALVGESGCGKSMTALALMRLLPDAGRVTGGSVLLEGQDVLALPESRMRSVRGGRIGMIFQEPSTSLNPVMRVGDQIVEAIEAHTALRGSAIWSPTRITGFRLVDGSWKIMPMRPPRTKRMRDSGSASTSCASSITLPLVMLPASGSRRISASAVMLLPQPDSPTSAKVSPRSMQSVRPSMALTRPASASSATFRSSIFSMLVAWPPLCRQRCVRVCQRPRRPRSTACRVPRRPDGSRRHEA